jgi:hypothetical protein
VPNNVSGAWAFVGVGVDLGIGGGSAKIKGEMDLLEIAFPLGLRYGLERAIEPLDPPTDIDILAEPSRSNWSAPWERYADVDLTLLKGRIDLTVKAWIKILWKKLQKTWKKNIVDWTAYHKGIMLDSSDSTSDLGTTVNMVTLPDLEVNGIPSAYSWLFHTYFGGDYAEFRDEVEELGMEWNLGGHCGILE